MLKKPLSITHLLSGGIITNYHCTSACGHCLYRCSPKWPKDYISRDSTRKIFESIINLGCRSIHVGGGEPLLNPDCVMSVLEAAEETGIQVEYVETNSSWYKNINAACRVLEQLAQKGLSTLLVSISPFHNEHIPFFKVMGVMEACRRTGLAVFPWVSDFISDIQTFDVKKTHSLEEYLTHFGNDYLKNILNRYWIAFGGRALATFGEIMPKRSIKALAENNSCGCPELAETSHFHFDPYENYIPGLCAGLSISREDMGKPLDPEKYPIISCLFSNGVGGLLSYTIEKYNFQATKTLYTQKYELCYEVRRSLVMDHDVHSRELQPLGHYLND